MSETFEQEWSRVTDLIKPNGRFNFCDHETMTTFRETTGYGLPNAQTMKELAALLETWSARILSIGCGKALVEHALMRLTSLPIICTDIKPYDPSIFVSSDSYECMNSKDATSKFYQPDSCLITCWPLYDHTMASDAVAHPWEYIIYIGEGEGGCTGDDLFHSVLETKYEEIQHGECVNWAAIHSHVFVYRRRT
jgi:hypothetical protein